MKCHLLVSALLLILQLINAQEPNANSAIENAQALIRAVNENDYKTYADYLTPEIYPFEDKTQLYQTWNRMLERDSRNFTDIELTRIGTFNGTQQAYFTLKIEKDTASVIGISHDNGNTWHFTSFIGKFFYQQVKERMMPQLDISFADFDANYKKRINFNKGELISPFEFVDINGNHFKSNELIGKTIVLNFWSTSCGPCIKEIPELNKLVKKMKSKNIVFIAPAFYDKKESLLDNFLPKNPFKYNVATANADDYSISSVPTHIIIDKTQKVREIIIGYSKENLSKLEHVLNQL